MRSLATAIIVPKRVPKFLLPLSILLLLGAIWGGTFSLSKLAVNAGVPPLGYALWQCVGSAIVVQIICTFRRQRLTLSRRYIAFYSVCGFVGIAIPISSMYLVIAHLPAGVMGVIVATIPLFTYAFSYTLNTESLDWRRVAGIALGFIGVLFILVPRASLPVPEMAFWAAVALLTPIFYAIGNVYTGWARPPDSSAITLTVGMLLAAIVGLAPVVLITGGFYWLRIPPGIAEFAILGQILVSSLGYILFFELIRIAGPVYFSQVGYVVTVTGMMWAALLFDETYSHWVFASVALIFAGLALVNLPRRKIAS